MLKSTWRTAPPDDYANAQPASFVTHCPYRQQTFNPSPLAAAAWALLLVAKQPMKPFFWNLADWCVLAIIVWAHDMNTPTAERLLDAAGVWVGVANGLAMLHLTSLLIYKDARAQLQEESTVWSNWENINYYFNFIVGIFVFAWAGWIFTLGIRLLYQVMIELLINKNNNSI